MQTYPDEFDTTARFDTQAMFISFLQQIEKRTRVGSPSLEPIQDPAS
jgi:hypothetical protein